MSDDNDQGTISAYNPSWTDKVAQKLAGDNPSPWWSGVVQNLTGSTGLGSTGSLSAKDFVPIAGQVLNAQQAYHDDKSWPEIGLNLIPGASTEGRITSLAGEAASRAVPDMVDLARRSLFMPREKPTTAPTPEAVAPPVHDYRVDNPGGSWVENKQANASGSKLTRGTDTATVGLNNKLTLPTEMVAKLKGVNDENPVPGTMKYDRLAEDVDEKGFTNENPVAIVVNHKGEAYINDGNHRAAVARDKGVPRLASTVYWMNGAEDVPGPWHPDNVLPHVKPVEAKTFLDKPVNRRAVNEGILGAGAAAVGGPGLIKGLTTKAAVPAAKAAVTLAKATPDVIAANLDSIMARPLSLSHPVLNKHLTEEGVKGLIDPLTFKPLEAAESPHITNWHLLDNATFDDIGSELAPSTAYKDPSAFVTSMDKPWEMHGDATNHIRSELETSIGHKLTDDEFKSYLTKANRRHWSIDNMRRDVMGDGYGYGDEHPSLAQAETIMTNLGRNSTSGKAPTVAEIRDILGDHFTPEGLLKSAYDYPEEEIPKALSAPQFDGRTLKEHLDDYIFNTLDDGMLGKEMIDYPNLKSQWKRGAEIRKHNDAAKVHPEGVAGVVKDLGAEHDKAYAKYEKVKAKLAADYPQIPGKWGSPEVDDWNKGQRAIDTHFNKFNRIRGIIDDILETHDMPRMDYQDLHPRQ